MGLSINKKDLELHWWYITTMGSELQTFLFFLLYSHFSISRQANSIERGKLTGCIGFFFWGGENRWVIRTFHFISHFPFEFIHFFLIIF